MRPGADEWRSWRSIALASERRFASEASERWHDEARAIAGAPWFERELSG